MGTKIAVYTIALNEEKHVKRWYEATKDADYHLIADTGSTDKTIEIAKSLGINVYSISVKPFRFDDARNAALALLPLDIDICVSLDMDEVASEGFIQGLKDVWQKDATRAWVWWDTGQRWKNNNRVHRRDGIRWIKPCHEVTTYFGDFVEGGLPQKLLDTELLVHHKPDDTKSRGHYLGLLKMAVEEAPEDARMWAYLTREYFFHKNWKKVIESAESMMKAGGWYVERASVCRAAGEAYRQFKNMEKAKDWFLKGVQEAPDQLEGWFCLAQFAYETKNWQGCWDAANKITTLERQIHYLVDDSVWSWRCYDLLSISGWYLGKKEEALKYAEIAAKANPKDERLQNNLKWIKENSANI